jgi:hypothetical protein
MFAFVAFLASGSQCAATWTGFESLCTKNLKETLIQIKTGISPLHCCFCMSRERARDLALQCTELARNGNDFPNIWTALLKRHPLVEGIPQSKIIGGRAMLEIRLITGERLLFDGDAKRFSLG